MQKRKWLWKRKSSEMSSFDSGSSGSSSLHSDKDCNDQQEAFHREDIMKETARDVLEKLSAALGNVSAKEELAKQHVKVAEEAIVGWEDAEKQVSNLKLQIDVAVQQNVNLEVRVTHLEAALEECMAQLTHAEANACSDPKSCFILEKENSFLKKELVSICKDLEIVMYERDLSIQAAENSRKLQLEAMKKVVKLESELRRMQLLTRKLSPPNNKRSVTAAYFYADSFTDCGDGASVIDAETLVTSNMELNTLEQDPASLWASALIAELDQFKNEKPSSEGLRAFPMGIGLMDDFLEMERLAGLPDTKTNTPDLSSSGSPCRRSASLDSPLMADCYAAFERADELEKKLENAEVERIQLETVSFERQVSLNEGRSKLKELVSKESRAQLLDTENGASIFLGDNVKKIENEREQKSSVRMMVQELDENEPRVTTKGEGPMIHEKENTVSEKQKNLSAADKLAECQNTIASLRRQLQSLATHEDFMVDTSNIPGFSRIQAIFATTIASDESRNLEKMAINQQPLFTV